MINLYVRALKANITGTSINSTQTLSKNKTAISALADTGCQSCLAGTNLLHKLNLTTSNLIPVKTKMRSANNEGINLLGAILLNLSGSDAQGRTFSSNQMTYITNCSDTFFLSRSACNNLGIISETFPTIGEAFLEAVDTSVNSTEDQQIAATPPVIAPCGCPQRSAPPPLPNPPMAINDTNRVQLQEFLLDHYASSTFNTCPHQPLPHMSGPPMKLMVDPNATPIANHKAIPVPLHFREKVKQDLDRDVQLGVLERVPMGTATTWCHRMVVCAKKDGTPRRTIDFQALNKHACRETHHTSSPFHLARSVPSNTKKTVCDAWNGYHGVRLLKKDRHITTFITDWGRYRYKTAPQGYIASGDGYTSRYDAIISEVKDKIKCVDDTLLWAADTRESFIKTAKYLELCGRNGIILNPTKFTFAADEVEFAGFNITKNNVKPCNKYIQAINEFPSPKNLTDIRSWFGLVNQASYAFSKTKTMEPFRELLKSGSKFEWTNELNNAFQASKTTIIKEIEEGVRIFDKSRTTCLATDWSKSGIGFWLLQKHCKCPGSMPLCCPSGWKVTLVGSRFTHSAESRYAPVEGEALAVVNALEKAKHFVLGCENLIIAVDHKPLLKLFGNRALEDIPNSRLRNLKEKTLSYRFHMVHVAGVKNKVADGLSRHPSGPAERIILPDDIASVTKCDEPLRHSLEEGNQIRNPHNLDIEACTVAMVLSTFEASPITSTTWDLVRTATTSDETLNELLKIIENGFPNSSKEIPQHLRAFFPLRDHLSTVDGVIIYNDRVVVPTSLRHNVIATLHAAHQGVSTMIARAESSVFWPGITKDIHNVRDRCHQCNRNAPSNPSAPPIPPILPDYPFQCVCADYFTHKGIPYLVIVDRYSNWPIVEKSRNGAAGLISSLRQTFTTFGVPEELASDGGPEFTAAITHKFLKDYGIHHRLSSVAYPQSNGRAELGVKTVKRLMMDNTGPNGDLNNDAFQRAMLQYRNTPDRDTRMSPAISIFGHHIRDFIPVVPHKYRPKGMWSSTLTAREDALRTRHMKMQERLTEHTKRLLPLKVGHHVHIQNQTGPHPLKWDKTGIVIEVYQYDQYMVKIDGSNRTTLRNRKFLRQFLPIKSTLQPRSIVEDFRQDRVTEKPPSSSTTEIILPQAIPQSHPDLNMNGEIIPPQQRQEQEVSIGPSSSIPTNPTQYPVNEQIYEPPIRRSSRPSNPPARLIYSELGNPENY